LFTYLLLIIYLVNIFFNYLFIYNNSCCCLWFTGCCGVWSTQLRDQWLAADAVISHWCSKMSERYSGTCTTHTVCGSWMAIFQVNSG